MVEVIGQQWIEYPFPKMHIHTEGWRQTFGTVFAGAREAQW